MKISVLGSGTWGTALAMLLEKNGHNVTLWSFFESEIEEIRKNRTHKFLKGIKVSENIALTSNLDQATDADMLVLAVPSHVVRNTCRSLKKYDNLPLIVNVAKGFDEGTNQRLSEVIKQELDADCVVLSGPTHAEEVALGIPTTIVAACGDIEKAELVQNTFICETFRVYTNTDVTGVEVCGAIKNVIALCAGISDGSGYGDNTKAALMTRGIKEISRLGIALGGNLETFMGLTGIGDLIVTCTSMHSRNRRAGILIGQGKSLDEAVSEVGMVVEGVKSCVCTKKLADDLGIEMPIVSTAYDILYNGVSPQDAVKTLMLRESKPE